MELRESLGMVGRVREVSAEALHFIVGNSDLDVETLDRQQREQFTNLENRLAEIRQHERSNQHHTAPERVSV